ncbi:MAG TPA: hypothetical protein VHC49_15170 [Mycobacteriales bacterium]|nr:hypothetical protein [Mycobacteriales bacterium]
MMHGPISRRSLLAGAAAGSALALAPAATARADATPITAHPDRRWDGLFNAYSDSGIGWTGADSTYSVPLPDGRIVWIFSDTFLGPVGPGRPSHSPPARPKIGRPRTAPFLHNSFIVQTGSHLRTVYGGTAGAPDSLVSPAGADPDTSWYWAAAGTIGPGTLDVVYNRYDKTGPGVFDFAWSGSVLARFGLLDQRLIDVTDLPSARPNIQSGSWLSYERGWTYHYRIEDLSSEKYLHIARVRGHDLRQPWEFFTGSGWSPHEADSVRVLDRISGQFSVTRDQGRYVLITHDTSEPFSSRIVAYFATTPVGPFTDVTPVYSTPETGAAGTYGNPNVFTYNSCAHPELSRPGHLLVSYNVNSFEPDDLYRDVSIYRPRFIDVDISARRVQHS